MSPNIGYVSAGSASCRAGASSSFNRDLVAITRSLGWAQESAARGDYTDALGWVGVITEIGAQILGDQERAERDG